MKRQVSCTLCLILLVLCLASGPVAAEASGITMEFKEADLLDVLRVLGKMSGNNVVADRTVKGTVTVSLKDVPFEQAIDLIARTAGFGFAQVGNTFVVATPDRIATEFQTPEEAQPPAPPAPELITSVYKLEYARPADATRSLDLVLSPDQMRADERSASLIVTATQADHERVAKLIEEIDIPVPEAPKPPAPTESTRVYRLYHSNPADAVKFLDIVLPADKMRTDERTSSLIVTATESEHAEVESLIAQLDTPKAQVLIQARLEELSGDAMRDLGVNWNFSTLLTKDSIGRTIGIDLGIEPILKAMEDKGHAVLLARPEISTLDGQTGRILIGDRIPIVIDEMVDGQMRRSIENIEAGVKLSITPRVNDNGTLTVTIKPEISTITGFSPQGYPQIRTREAETTVRIKDGQTVAIGGLFQTDEIEQMMKIPILSDLPVLGSLFTTKKIEAKESEIVIFLTSYIIEGTDFSKAAPTIDVELINPEPEVAVPVP